MKGTVVAFTRCVILTFSLSIFPEVSVFAAGKGGQSNGVVPAETASTAISDTDKNLRDALSSQYTQRQTLNASTPKNFSPVARQNRRTKFGANPQAKTQVPAARSPLPLLQGAGAARKISRQQYPEAVERLMQANKLDHRFTLITDSNHKSVRALRGRFALPSARGTQTSFAKRGKQFVENYREVFSPRGLPLELQVHKAWNEPDGKAHAQYTLAHDGVPYLHQMLSIHGDSEFIEYLGGNYLIGEVVTDKDAVIDLSLATDNALNVLSLNRTDLYAEPESVLAIQEVDGEFRHVYVFHFLFNNMQRWAVLIDALTGNLVSRQLDTPTNLLTASGTDLLGVTQLFTAWAENGSYYMLDPSTPSPDPEYSPLDKLNPTGDHVIMDALNLESFDELSTISSTSLHSGWDPVGVSVFTNTQKVFDYFKSTHSRDSIDNEAQNLLSIVHYGESYENAYWNGTFMVYGDGGSLFNNLGQCLDIVAHEFTHGVIESSARLIYMNQAGALNESFADVFAALVDSSDWELGEDCLREGGALRSLSHPHEGAAPQPSHMDEYLDLPNTPSGDYGGVHINSGIPNRAAYLLAEGLSVEGLGDSIGRNKLGHIFYRALTTYLLPTSTFIDARYATVQSAEDLYGTNSNEAIATGKAWDAVGVTTASSVESTGGELVEANPGDDLYVYLYRQDEGITGEFGSAYDLYTQIIDKPFTGYATANDVGPLESVIEPVYARPSALTVDGVTFVFYIGKDNNLYSIDTTTGGSAYFYGENDIYSFAVSEDGNKFAFTFLDDDENIWVFDLETESWEIFPLSSPDYTTDGSTAGNSLYADSLAFDYTGTQLIYDYASCLPQLGVSCNDADALVYWSIGILNIRNGSTVFPMAWPPEEFDVGFPRFATNDSRHIVFDVHDYSGTQGYEVVSSIVSFDLLTGFLELPALTSDPASGFAIWGAPSYTGDDDYVVYASRTSEGRFTGSRTKMDNYLVDRSVEQETWNPYPVVLPTAHRAAERAVRPSLSVSSKSLNFGDVDSGATNSLSLNISNTGNAPLDIEKIAISGSYFGTNLRNQVLLPGETVSAQVTFYAGNVGGIASSVLSITHSGEGGIELINLSGNVKNPSVVFETVDDNGDGVTSWNEAILVNNDLTVEASDMRLLRLYIGALGRTPDLGGFDYWRTRINDGTLISRLGDEFFYSPEMQTQMDTDGSGAVSNEEFIAHLYTNVLQREADSAGFNYWVGQLEKGVGAGEVMANYLNAQEFIDLTIGQIADFASSNTSSF